MSGNKFNEAKKYPAKLLLVGEYTVLSGGTALGLPYPGFSASWSRQDSPDARLSAFLNYLLRDRSLAALLDLGRFGVDLNAGLYLESNIPASSGLGSSGSVVAAVWDRYGKLQPESPEELKSIFAAMESFFHGSSSGLDPLIIYLDKPVISRQGSLILSAQEIPLITENYQITLVDSGIPRSTKDWVDLFKIKMQDPEFKRSFEEEWMPANEDLIQALLNAQRESVIAHWQRISRFQMEWMPEFIPKSISQDWSGPKHFFKLCGAGGGGYFLKIQITDRR
jgi:mevalonate kinase